MKIEIPAHGKKAKFLLTMVMASLMANDCSPQDVHSKLNESQDIIRKKAADLDGDLSKIFETTIFMIEWMMHKGADAYNFFFEPDEFSIKTLLTNGQLGANEITEDLKCQSLNSEEVIAFYQAVKHVIECVNKDYADKRENLYIMLLVAIDGFIELGEKS